MRRFAIFTMCMAGALCLASSCSKVEETNIPSEENEEPIIGNRTIINGLAEAIGGDEGTKAYNAYCYEVRWQNNDEIYVTKADGTDDIFVLSDGVDTPKGKFIEKGTKGITGAIEAFYPADLRQSDKYVWPAIQSKDQVALLYAKQNISGTGAETVNFSSLGAMLQIVFNSKTPDITVTSVTITDASKPMSGTFTVNEKGQAVISDNPENPGITLDLGESGVKMGSSAKNFFIAIPAGKYYGDEVTITMTAKDGRVFKSTSKTFPDIIRNTVAMLTFSGTFKSNKPEGALSGKFTVNSDGKQVYFSQGNLYWNGSNFKFEDAQTAYSSWSASHVSYFFWSNDAAVAYNKTYSDASAAVDDIFFTNKELTTANPNFSVLVGDVAQKGVWRTLSNAEWDYLISTRQVKGETGFGKTCLYTTINSMKGLVVFPDDYTGEVTGLTSIPEGCVFLPAAGRRFNNGTMDGVNSEGRYWASMGERNDGLGLQAYVTIFVYNQVKNLYSGALRSHGLSVRLVTDCD